MNILSFIIDRLKERSTWIGITGLLTIAGVALEPEQIEAISLAGIAVASAIAAFTKDNK